MRNLVLPLAATTAAILLSSCTMTPADIARADAQKAATADALSRELAGLSPAGTTDCMDRYQTSSLKAYGGVLVYNVSPKLKYVNDTRGGCEGVERGDILLTKSPTGRLCSGDIATTLMQGSRVPTGSCSLGKFTVYKR